MKRPRPLAESRDREAHVRDLTRRLLAAGAHDLRVDHLVGYSAVGSVFAARDIHQGRSLTLQLVDSDSAYDVGAPTFVRGIGSRDELGTPHILPPGRDGRARGAVYYLGPYTPAEPLAQHLARSRPIAFEDALLMCADVGRALARWHGLGLAHDQLDRDALLIQRGRVLVEPPVRFSYGWDAQRRDIPAFARVCLELIEESTEPPADDDRWQDLRDELAAAASQPGTRPSAGGLADRLTQVAERDVPRSGPTAGGPFSWLLALFPRARHRAPPRTPAAPGWGE